MSVCSTTKSSDFTVKESMTTNNEAVVTLTCVGTKHTSSLLTSVMRS